MANHYYQQQLKEEGSIINLVAIDNDNHIRMIIFDDVFDTTSAITLTEQEQDDLIIGILERRGYINITTLVRRLASNPIEIQPITAEGNEQSRIHPHKLLTR
jgi:hypothetical protein